MEARRKVEKCRAERLRSPLASQGFSLVQSMIDERSNRPGSSECRSIRRWDHAAVEPNSGKAAGSKVTAIRMKIAKRA